MSSEGGGLRSEGGGLHSEHGGVRSEEGEGSWWARPLSLFALVGVASSSSAVRHSSPVVVRPLLSFVLVRRSLVLRHGRLTSLVWGGYSGRR